MFDPTVFKMLNYTSEHTLYTYNTTDSIDELEKPRYFQQASDWVKSGDVVFVQFTDKKSAAFFVLDWQDDDVVVANLLEIDEED